MEDINEELLNEADSEFVIISKNRNDILNDVEFENEDERILCDSIITNLEIYAADRIRNMKTVSLPFIGTIRIDPVKHEFKEHKLHLGAIRKSLTKEDYKEHVRSFIYDFKNKQIEIDKNKIVLANIKKNNKIKYEKLYKTCGRAYAELFIKAISWLKEVPYSQEFEDYYKELRDKNKS